MQIDLNKLPKVDASKCCDAEGYYFFVNADGSPDICLKRKGGLFSSSFKYYGPIEFVLPKAIPPKPVDALHLMQLTKVIDTDTDVLGDLKWCIVDDEGNFWPLNRSGAGSSHIWLHEQCIEVKQ